VLLQGTITKQDPFELLAAVSPKKPAAWQRLSGPSGATVYARRSPRPGCSAGGGGSPRNRSPHVLDHAARRWGRLLARAGRAADRSLLRGSPLVVVGGLWPVRRRDLPILSFCSPFIEESEPFPLNDRWQRAPYLPSLASGQRSRRFRGLAWAHGPRCRAPRIIRSLLPSIPNAVVVP